MNDKLERYIMAGSGANNEVATELARLGTKYIDEIISLMLRLFRNLPQGMGPGTGMSEIQRAVASNGLEKAWGIINAMGWSGTEALISAIDSENHVKGVVACIILCENRAPTKKIADEIYKLQRFTEFNRTTQVDRATQVIGNLTGRVLALIGEPKARAWVEDLCRKIGVSYDVWLYGIVENAISFVRDS